MRVATFPTLLVFLLALSLTGLTGCASTKPLPNAPQRVGLVVEPADAAALGFSVNWAQHLSVPDSNDIVETALLDDLILVVEHPGNIVNAIEVDSGKVRWRSAIGVGDGRLFKPMAFEDRILINSVKSLYIVSADSGNVIDRVELAHVVQSQPTLHNDLALFGAVNGRVFAHQIRSGFPKWEYGMSTAISAPIAIDGDQLAVADDNGTSALLDVDTGAVNWRRKSYDRISTQPLLTENFAGFGSHDRSFYCLDRSTGDDLWIFRSERALLRPAAYLGNNVYLPVDGRGLFCIDPSTGESNWLFDRVATPLGIHDNRLLAYTRTALLKLDVRTGAVVAEAPTRRLTAVVQLPDNALVLVSPTGRVLRINPQN
ncbi:MAG: PQQ-binding-like beta-propeller repeat protein [Phycisphaeraceae bacterium]